MRIGLGEAPAVDNTLMPADPGLQSAVADWSAGTSAAINSTALNAGVYVPASVPAAQTLSQWLSTNSTVIVAGCAVLGLMVAMSKR